MKKSLWDGVKQLLYSPSGVFSLLTLSSITYITLRVPTVGGTAFCAFCAIVPGFLAYIEHKEQLLQPNQYIQQANVPTTIDINNNDLPNRGKL